MIFHSGIGRYIQNILPLIKDHFKITLLGAPDQLMKLNEVRRNDIIPFYSNIYSIKEQIHFPFLLNNVDIFWSPHYNVPLFPVRAKKRIVTVHDVFHLAFMDELSLIQKAYAKIVMNAAVTSSQSIITVSEFSKSEIIKYTSAQPDKISVVYNGIDTYQFRKINDQNRKNHVMKKYNLPEDYILYVGNVKPHKNLKALLIAFGMLKKESLLPNTRIVIVGKKEGFINSDNEIDNLIRSIGIDNEILFVSTVENDDLPVIYNLCNLFVFPSLYEGFGFPPLEAMACGCAVLTSDKPCMKEVCGPTAFYFNPENPEDLKSKIKDVYSNAEVKNNIISKNDEIVKKYTWQKAALSHIQLFDSL
jgi:glycosyltransferase involved in cell wall biosynthesis